MAASDKIKKGVSRLTHRSSNDNSSSSSSSSKKKTNSAGGSSDPKKNSGAANEGDGPKKDPKTGREQYRDQKGRLYTRVPSKKQLTAEKLHKKVDQTKGVLKGIGKAGTDFADGAAGLTKDGINKFKPPPDNPYVESWESRKPLTPNAGKFIDFSGYTSNDKFLEGPMPKSVAKAVGLDLGSPKGKSIPELERLLDANRKDQALVQAQLEADPNNSKLQDKFNSLKDTQAGLRNDYQTAFDNKNIDSLDGLIRANQNEQALLNNQLKADPNNADLQGKLAGLQTEHEKLSQRYGAALNVKEQKFGVPHKDQGLLNRLTGQNRNLVYVDDFDSKIHITRDSRLGDGSFTLYSPDATERPVTLVDPKNVAVQYSGNTIKYTGDGITPRNWKRLGLVRKGEVVYDYNDKHGARKIIVRQHKNSDIMTRFENWRVKGLNTVIPFEGLNWISTFKSYQEKRPAEKFMKQQFRQVNEDVKMQGLKGNERKQALHEGYQGVRYGYGGTGENVFTAGEPTPDQNGAGQAPKSSWDKLKQTFHRGSANEVIPPSDNPDVPPKNAASQAEISKKLSDAEAYKKWLGDEFNKKPADVQEKTRASYEKQIKGVDENINSLKADLAKGASSVTPATEDPVQTKLAQQLKDAEEAKRVLQKQFNKNSAKADKKYPWAQKQRQANFDARMAHLDNEINRLREQHDSYPANKAYSRVTQSSDIPVAYQEKSANDLKRALDSNLAEQEALKAKPNDPIAAAKLTRLQKQQPGLQQAYDAAAAKLAAQEAKVPPPTAEMQQANQLKGEIENLRAQKSALFGRLAAIDPASPDAAQLKADLQRRIDGINNELKPLVKQHGALYEQGMPVSKKNGLGRLIFGRKTPTPATPNRGAIPDPSAVNPRGVKTGAVDTGSPFLRGGGRYSLLMSTSMNGLNLKNSLQGPPEQLAANMGGVALGLGMTPEVWKGAELGLKAIKPGADALNTISKVSRVLGPIGAPLAVFSAGWSAMNTADTIINKNPPQAEKDGALLESTLAGISAATAVAGVATVPALPVSLGLFATSAVTGGLSLIAKDATKWVYDEMGWTDSETLRTMKSRESGIWNPGYNFFNDKGEYVGPADSKDYWTKIALDYENGVE